MSYFDTDVEIKSSVKNYVQKRNNDARIIIEIMDKAKELSELHYELSEKIRHPQYFNERDVEQLRQKLDYRYWCVILNQLQIEKMTTESDKDKIFQDLEEKTPVLTEENIHSYIRNLIESPDAIATNLVKKVYDRIVNLNFRVGNNIRNKSVCKNKSGIEKSFRASIFYNRCEGLPSYVSSRTSNFDLINDLERACYLVDGKLQPDRMKNFQALTDGVLRNRGNEVENDYFKMKMFKNGNVIIEFLNDEVLSRLNSWGTDGKRIATR